MSKTSKVGVLYNPNSRHGLSWFEKQSAQLQGSHIFAIGTKDLDDLPEALQAMAREGITHLAVIGGDGTLDAILTALRNHQPFAHEPVIALFDAGTTNMTFKDVGFKSRRRDPLREFVQGAAKNSLNVKKHRPLLIKSAALNQPLYGFFMGMAAVPRAIHQTRSKFHQKGLTNSLSEGATILTSLTRLLRQKNLETDPILSPVPIEINLDGHNKRSSATLLALTSLRKLLVGIKPYHGSNDGFSVMGIFHPCDGLFKKLPALLYGTHELPLSPDNNLAATQGHNCVLTFDGEWTLDGEMHQTTSQTPLTIEQGAPITFAVGVA